MSPSLRHPNANLFAFLGRELPGIFATADVLAMTHEMRYEFRVQLPPERFSLTSESRLSDQGTDQLNELARTAIVRLQDAAFSQLGLQARLDAIRIEEREQARRDVVAALADVQRRLGRAMIDVYAPDQVRVAIDGVIGAAAREHGEK